MIVCERCGTQNSDDAQFCGKCRGFLEWSAEHVTKDREPPPKPPERPTEEVEPAVPRHRVLVAATIEEPIHVEPGESHVLEVRIRNEGAVVDELEIEIGGEAAEWSEARPSTLRLFPGTEGTAAIEFHPSRGITPTAGQHGFTITVRSSEDRAASDGIAGSLDVGVYSLIEASLTPRTSRGRSEGAHGVTVRNMGNSAAQVRLEIREPDLLLETVVVPASFTLEPGIVASAAVHVTPKPAVRGNQAVPFQVVILAASTPDRALDAGFVRLAASRIPRLMGLAAAAVVLATVALAGAGVILNGGDGTQAPPVTERPSRPTDNANMRAVTDVVGLSLQEAEARLRNDGFEVSPISETDKTRPAFQVIRTDPPVGTLVPKGSRITVYFAFGI